MGLSFCNLQLDQRIILTSLLNKLKTRKAIGFKRLYCLDIKKLFLKILQYSAESCWPATVSKRDSNADVFL